jgi:uncharacterized protein
MKILFALNHPAHYHLFKNTFRTLQSHGHETMYVIKNKDILEKLMESDNQPFTRILENVRTRRRSNASILYSVATELLMQDSHLYQLVHHDKPDILIGTDIAITHIGKLINRPSIVLNEDDFNINKLFCKTTYPFASHIISPFVCKTGKYSYKKVPYNGYQKLAYLHPAVFTPEKEVIRAFNPSLEKFFLIRMVSFTASHDIDQAGLNIHLLRTMIERLEKEGKVYLSSEGQVLPEFSKYLLPSDPIHIHHILSAADLFITDSQSMTVEASVLGTPSIRFNSFAGKISVLEELEKKYGLTMGITNKNPKLLFEKIDELLKYPNLREEFQEKRRKMLEEKINVSAFLTWFLENYPGSVKILKKEPEYQERFK